MPFPGMMPPGAMPPPGMMGPGGMPLMPPPGMMDGDTSGKLAMLARGSGRRVSTDLVRQAISLLEQAREMDDKQAPNITAAIHVLRNGTERLEDLGRPPE